MKYCNSTALFSSYNGSVASIAGTTGTQIEWMNYVQTGGNGQAWWDSNSGTQQSGTVTDSALGTVSGIAAYVTQTFQQGVPGVSNSTFVPQSASVAKLPFGVLP